MTLFQLILEKRTTLGKGVKHLRTGGITPAVIHNHGKESIIVQGDSGSMLKVYRKAGKHHTVEVKAEGKTYTTLIKDAEFEPRKNTLTHLVFNAVSANQKVEAEIPVHAKYDEGNEGSPAERAGLLVIGNLDAIVVEAIPSALPDVIYYNGEKLENVGDHVTVGDLILPEGVTVKEDDNQTIATVFEPSAVAAANDAAGGTEEPEAETEETAEGETAETTEEGNEKPAES